MRGFLCVLLAAALTHCGSSPYGPSTKGVPDRVTPSTIAGPSAIGLQAQRPAEASVRDGLLVVHYLYPDGKEAGRRIFLIDGDPRGVTNQTVRMPAGVYTITLGTGAAYAPDSQTVQVPENGHVETTFTEQ